MTLGRSDLKSYAVLIFFSLNNTALQQLAKCCGMRKMSLLRMERLRGEDEVVEEWRLTLLLDFG